jgi:hypothetical protein
VCVLWGYDREGNLRCASRIGWTGLVDSMKMREWVEKVGIGGENRATW